MAKIKKAEAETLTKRLCEGETLERSELRKLYSFFTVDTLAGLKKLAKNNDAAWLYLTQHKSVSDGRYNDIIITDGIAVSTNGYTALKCNVDRSDGIYNYNTSTKSLVFSGDLNLRKAALHTQALELLSNDEHILPLGLVLVRVVTEQEKQRNAYSNKAVIVEIGGLYYQQRYVDIALAGMGDPTAKALENGILKLSSGTREALVMPIRFLKGVKE